MIDMDEAWLEEIKRILSRIIPEYEVWAFGSRIKGNNHKYSDLDLALISETRIDWRLIESLKDEFSESDLPIRVDVVDYKSVPEVLKKMIEVDHVVIKDADMRNVTGSIKGGLG